MTARTFRKRKQQQSRVFFGVTFYVYTNVDNRERARERELLKTKETMRNASGQQGENQWQ